MVKKNAKLNQKKVNQITNKLFKIVNINNLNSAMPIFDELTNQIIPKKDWSFLSFKIKPLSVAKYFYEKGIELNSTIQDLLYLSFVEVLKKEGRFLFTEEFQAWRAGPTLGSVFLRMHNYFRQKGTYEGLFDKYPSLNNEKVIQHLESVYQQYQKHAEQKKESTFAQKAKDRSWKAVRKPLNDSLDYRSIPFEILIKHYANNHRKKSRV